MSRNPGEPSRELEEVARALDQAARLERETIAATGGEPTADELLKVAATLERARGTPGGTTRRQVWWIAAGLIVGALLLWRFLPRDEAPTLPGRVVLGEGQVEIVEPLEGVKSFTRVRWRTGSQGQPRYKVQIHDDATDELLLEETDLPAFELSLDNQDTHAWKRIRIKVYELEASGQEGRGTVARAWLSP